MAGNESIRIHDALDGNTKSSTMLMAEVQMLMHKWKQTVRWYRLQSIPTRA